ncbi:MraY family glycosyltransferase [Xylanibacter muris]|uniref:Undecaprenyl/decaprenyl-phosphate alpha-N-acetylglucosaminyl 1-phosphate transferase n=1 Tax=Xylanibacter muris TaxID=2736290 RepID=A0ABX2AQ80_9BACT|nr:MraY family glycosyltransferase [Xylanibacter muris]NPD92365.1 undecaprenyl/decaprenyl-phosphate alpha-N-acetylglucosaminyl 1-phosphate transferase [Xylanibacter muris]
MTLYLLYILVSFVVSMACGFILIPLIIRFCRANNLYDLPNARKVHKRGIPRLGGICFAPNMLFAAILALIVFNATSSVGNKIQLNLWAAYFIISLLMIYSVGLIDDLVGLGAKTKFIVQIISASILPAANLYINNLYGLLGIYTIPYWIGAPLTVFVIVFIVNAMNLIDGIDGLSAGLSFISLGGFLVFFALEGMFVYCVLIAGLMGVILAFMYFNIFGKSDKGTKIFMGDSGSLTIGFILGVMLIKYSMMNTVVMPVKNDRLIMACTLLIVPVFDVCRVIIVRSRHRKPIFDADKNHIHHKMMRAGLTQHGALRSILGMEIIFIMLNICLSKFINFNYIVITDIIVWMLFQTVINHFIRKNGKKEFLIEAETMTEQ